ncbi:MAG: nitroreductase family protein [Bacteroidales bacterium]|nr:nitroreductase family protein [Bacteroidales bacterium]
MEKEVVSTNEAALSVIYNRKSVRNFIADKPIGKEDIDRIIRAGFAAPSGRDSRPWEIVVVDDREVLDGMAEKLPYAKMLAQSPLAMIVCGDTTKSSYWYVDCSAVTENILLAVEALGLGAVWTAAYPYEDRTGVVAEYLHLPDNILPLVVIPMGYPQGEHKPKDKYDPTKIHYNKW